MVTDNNGESDNTNDLNITSNLKLISNSNPNTNNTKQTDVNKFKTEIFKHTDKGPYNVLIEKTNIEEFHVAQTLMKYKFDKSVTNLTKVSKHKMRVTFKDYASANKLLRIESFNDFKDYKIFIPIDYVTTYGVLRNIPTTLTVDFIKQNIISSTPISSIERMTWWNRDTQEAKESTTIKIQFRAQKIPEEVRLCMMLLKVSLFIPKPLLCYKCFIYGHTKNVCKAEKSTCKTCGEDEHETNVTCKPACKQCKTNSTFQHSTGDKKCPEFANQIEIKTVMAKKKVTYYEAKKMLKMTEAPIQEINPFPSLPAGPTLAEILKTGNQCKVIDYNKPSTSKQYTESLNKGSIECNILKELLAITKKQNIVNCNDLTLFSINEILTNYTSLQNEIFFMYI